MELVQIHVPTMPNWGNVSQEIAQAGDSIMAFIEENIGWILLGGFLLGLGIWWLLPQQSNTPKPEPPKPEPPQSASPIPLFATAPLQ